MTFRDAGQAYHEREKAELRDRLDAERQENERLEASLRILREKVAASEDEPELSPKVSLLANAHDVLMTPFRAVGSGIRGFFEIVASIAGGVLRFVFAFPWQFWLIAVVILGMAGILIHHEFYDIRDGYVTGKNYEPAHYEYREECSRDSNGQESCHTVQTWVDATYSLTISWENQSATWGVSEGVYNHVQFGEWYCERDLLHDAPCRRNRPGE